MTTESIDLSSKLKSSDEHFSHKEGIQSEANREPGKREFDWRIISVKIVCFVFIIFSWFVVSTPYASLVRYFLSPEVSYK